MEVSNLEPRALWQNFVRLNSVPRASKKEERVIDFMIAFGKDLGLETIKDAAGNVVIKKAATYGMEDRKTVILQSHLDMVHQKNRETIFDFDEQGIDMYVEGDWVRGRGTTLGADNGIGVAAIMALLASTSVEHPDIEAMFTVDEETGMTGAKFLDPVNFKGEILLNLDTEDDDELTIGCAGGIDTNTRYTYQQENTDPRSTAFEVHLRGLKGGHSGMDINLGRANANKLMNRFLFTIAQTINIQLYRIDGGSLRNAIPRESTAIVIVPFGQKELFLLLTKQFFEILKDEYQTLEPLLMLTTEETVLPAKAMVYVDFQKIINTLYTVPNGVFRMSPDIRNLVEASSNLARVIVKDGEFITQSLQRSSVESTKTDVVNAVGAAFDNMGCNVQRNGDYPGWKPNPDSTVLRLMTNIYQELFNKVPRVEACHAGLECGILGSHLPGIDMISFGPTIRGAHSPDECVQISSVQKFWKFLLATLKEVPKRDK